MLRFAVLIACVAAAMADCGNPAIQPNVNTMIVGGETATPGSWPWQVSMRKNYLIGSGNYHFCGGTLIDNQWVISAAHCFDPVGSFSNYEVVLGSHDRDDTDLTQVNAKVSGIWVHENYDSRTFDNDIAILKLETPVTLTAFIDTACVATTDFAVGTQCVVTGWGDQEVAYNSKLQQVKVPILDNAQCNQPLWYNGGITENMFCAGYALGGQDSCQGDSGGPVVCQNSDGIWDLMGVVSWGYGCAEKLKPGVYTRVPNYQSWIAEKMNSN